MNLYAFVCGRVVQWLDVNEWFKPKPNLLVYSGARRILKKECSKTTISIQRQISKKQALANSETRNLLRIEVPDNKFLLYTEYIFSQLHEILRLSLFFLTFWSGARIKYSCIKMLTKRMFLGFSK